MRIREFKLVLVAVAVVAAGSAVAANNQIWFKQALEVSPFEDDVWKGLRIKVEQDERFNEHWFIDSETLVMFGWKMSPCLSVYLGNRWVYTTCRTSPRPGHRPMSTGLNFPTSSSRNHFGEVKVKLIRHKDPA